MIRLVYLEKIDKNMGPLFKSKPSYFQGKKHAALAP